MYLFIGSDNSKNWQTNFTLAQNEDKKVTEEEDEEVEGDDRTPPKKMAKIRIDLQSIGGNITIPHIKWRAEFLDKYAANALLKDLYTYGGIGYELWVEWCHDVERSSLPSGYTGAVWIYVDDKLVEYYANYKPLDGVMDKYL